ncbi:MAG TPA: hypothetical protein VHV83_10875 [Armatimonadota bacterium]|nr:hypothetical protein [Armatimonadota bacterium]
MQKYFHFVLPILVLFAIISLAGCGGGSKSSSLPTGDPIAPQSPAPPVTMANSYTVTDVAVQNGTARVDLAPNDLLIAYANSSYSGTCNLTLGRFAPITTPAATLRASRPFGGDTFSAHLRQQERELGSAYGTPKQIVSRTTATPLAVGDVQQFWRLQSPDNSYNHIQVSATLRAIGSHCYIFVDNGNGTDVSDATVQHLLTEWEENFYPTLTTEYGSPTDVDNDQHIFILISLLPLPASGDYYIGGYFDASDLYQTPQYSNHHEMVYLNPYAFTVHGSTDDFNTLPHEFAHMIDYNYKHGQEWISINEGLACLASYLTGYGLTSATSTGAFGQIDAFEENPWCKSLFVQNGSFGIEQYGATLLFFTYLYEHFPAKIKAIVTSGSTMVGTNNITACTGEPITTLFHDWAIANVLDGISTDPRYSYQTIDLKGNLGIYSTPLPGIPVESLLDANAHHILASWSLLYYHAPRAMTCTITADDRSKPFSVIRLTAGQ